MSLFRVDMIPDLIPNPRSPRSPTSSLDIEVSDGAVHVPFPRGVLGRCVPGHVDDSESFARGPEIPELDRAGPRLGNQAHRRDHELHLWRGRAHVPAKHPFGLPRERGKAHVDECDEWSGDVGHEHQRGHGAEGG